MLGDPRAVSTMRSRAPDAPVLKAPRSSGVCRVLRAVLLVLKSPDGPTLRAALAVLETVTDQVGRVRPLAAALRVGYWTVRDFESILRGAASQTRELPTQSRHARAATTVA